METMQPSSDAPVIIPFTECQPAFTRIQPGWLVVLASLAVLSLCAAGSGFLAQWARSAELGEGLVVRLLTTAFPVYLAWLQWQGTFRKHERRANSAANWLIGIAAVLANGLAALPFTGLPLTLPVMGILVALIVLLSGAGVLNLIWARRLRGAGWNEEEHGWWQRWWSFAVADLLILMGMVAVLAGTFAQFPPQREGTKWRPRNDHGEMKLLPNPDVPVHNKGE